MSATPAAPTTPSAPPPAPGAAPKPAPDSSGRDAQGRFTKGNPGGPGNPFARRMAAYRKEMAKAVTKEDMRVIALALREKAKAGDVAAARLLLGYLLGKPAAAPDPDRLDLEEFRLFEAEMVGGERLSSPYHGVPVDVVRDLARAARPDVSRTWRRQLAAGMRASLPPGSLTPDVPLAVSGDRPPTGSNGPGQANGGPKASGKGAGDRPPTGANGGAAPPKGPAGDEGPSAKGR
jgi:hypothetical protein